MIKIDGSSTVYPITEAVAEEFGKISAKAKVTVGISGTGGGFKKFCAGETHISDASRPIKAAEIAACKEKGIDYIELPVAYDALSIVVNPKNSWATSMTVAELKKLWEPEAQAKIIKWNQIRPEWPDKPIALFGAGVDSGTYDYFTEAIVGKEHSSRGDFTSSEDDNTLVQGVASDANALGFFGFAYYLENADKLKAVAVDDGKPENGAGPQLPSHEAVVKGVYQPLSRPLFIYVSKAALESPELKRFVEFYLKKVGTLAKEVGYVELQPEVYTLATERLKKTTTGSIFASGGSQVGVTLADLLKREQG
jgi:phosphate transport system substrate-binding protein